MSNLRTATLGGGCFWCLEAVFDQLEGVVDVVSGYSNGEVPNPSYEQVCRGTTGHAEVVKVVFDADVISYVEILGVFFSIHDPTTLNRQGSDVGTQYRSGIYTHSEEQARIAKETIAHLTKEDLWGKPIVTEVVPAGVFYAAEDYHQEYFAHNPGQGYCMAVVSPKVSKFRKQFAARLKK
ncbi:MAG: peptide-methionine (S)-S-oxide reductase MsrA [Burkholderiales bacterium]|jgi:peptide-methionine (S)-S-oxide reductase